MENIITEILVKVDVYKYNKGSNPTHIILGIDKYYELKNSIGSLKRIYIPAEYTRDGDFDMVQNLIIALLPNTSTQKDYMEVL